MHWRKQKLSKQAASREETQAKHTVKSYLEQSIKMEHTRC